MLNERKISFKINMFSQIFLPCIRGHVVSVCRPGPTSEAKINLDLDQGNIYWTLSSIFQGLRIISTFLLAWFWSTICTSALLVSLLCPSNSRSTDFLLMAKPLNRLSLFRERLFLGSSKNEDLFPHYNSVVIRIQRCKSPVAFALSCLSIIGFWGCLILVQGPWCIYMSTNIPGIWLDLFSYSWIQLFYPISSLS